MKGLHPSSWTGNTFEGINDRQIVAVPLLQHVLSETLISSAALLVSVRIFSPPEAKLLDIPVVCMPHIRLMCSSAGRMLALGALLGGLSRKADFLWRAWLRAAIITRSSISQCAGFEHRLVSADWHWCRHGAGTGTYPSHLFFLSPPTLTRWAPWWPSAGSAPRKLLTGASSATSSLPGLWLSRWLACSVQG